MTEKFWRMLGMACRARRLVFGSDAVERGVRAGKVVLVILADDVGPNTKDKIGRLSVHYEVPLITAGDRQTLGHWTGRETRVVIGVVDEGFANTLSGLAAADN